MKYYLSLFFSCCILTSMAQVDSPATLKSVLLEQLKTTHNIKDWFVPPAVAIAGLTAKQANWKDSTGNHSIAQLTTHLIFWNKQLLDKFQGLKPDTFNGNNNETFAKVDENSWKSTVLQLDTVLAALENFVQNSDEIKLGKLFSTIAHIGTHNAYHAGQILYIRKMRGWWDDNNGVK